jgi:Zinc finger, C2H2 type
VAVSEVEQQAGDREVGTCHVCGRTFDSQAELSKHLLEAHDEAASADAPTG